MATLRFAIIISLSVSVPWGLALAGDAPVPEAKQGQSALESSIELTQQISLFNQQIVYLESEVGPFAHALLEPLQGLTALLVEAGDFDEANRNLNRRLQLLHTLEGPSTLNQLQIISELISNDSRRGQWQSITEHLEYIHLIQTRNPDVDAAILLNSLNDIRAWHLAAIYIDEPRKRIQHFLDSRELQRRIISLAEQEYGDESEMLIPWLYSFAVEQHLVAAFLRSKDELGHEARRTIGREARGQDSYLREGSDIVERIQGIVETMDNLEAEAMAKIYLADFQMLRRQNTKSTFGGRVVTRTRGNAGRTYRSAMEMLKEAGIEAQRVEAFFARPVVLPVAQYHLSLGQALAQQAADGYTVTPSAGNGEGNHKSVHMGDFVAWNESLPSARRPAMPELAVVLDTGLNTVQVRFSIDSVGKSRTPHTEQAVPDSARVHHDAQEAIEDMQFRPGFINGRWRRIGDVTMRYMYPPPK